MGADDEARAAIAEISHCLLFAGRFAVKIENDGVRSGAERARRQLALDGRERIFERVHENAAHGIDDQRARTVFGLDHRRAAARRAGGIVDRTDQLWRALDEHQRLFLIPGVIAERDGVRAGLHQFTIDRLGDAETAGGILAVDYDQIELPVANEFGQTLIDDRAPAAADDIADEKNAHAQLPRRSIASRSVSTRSRRASRSVAGILGTSCAAKARPMAVTGLIARNRPIVLS